MARLSVNMRGALLMSATMAAFVLNDTLMKLLSEDANLFQSVMLRGLLTTALLAGLCHWRGVLRFRPAGADRKLLAWRMVAEIGQTVTYLNALFHMPIANTSAILQSLPLAVTLGAAVFLGERVGWRRYLAIAVGFAGVLLIVRPGTEGFNIYALSALGTVAFVVLRDLTTRRLSTGVPSLFAALLTSISVTLFAAICTPLEGWKPVTVAQVTLLSGAAVFLIFGYLFITMAMRTGDVAFSAPFRYTMLIWALLIGYLVFDDVPRPLTLVGAALVVASGIYAFYRERQLGHRAPLAAPKT